MKYNGYSVTFQEFPDEIALCVNISNCPCKCDGCSEPWLQLDEGTELTHKEIDKLIKKHPGITTFGFMGGDSDRLLLGDFADYIHKKHKKKVGFYSGRDYLDIRLIQHIDFYKIGRWINPPPNKRDWKKTVCGPINWPVSNQIFYEKRDGKLIDSTYKFRKNKLSDWERYIIKEEDK